MLRKLTIRTEPLVRIETSDPACTKDEDIGLIDEFGFGVPHDKDVIERLPEVADGESTSGRLCAPARLKIA